MLRFDQNKINYRKEKFGGLIINIETGKIYKLNKTGYRIFLSLYNGIELEKLIKSLQKEFRVNKNQIRKDVKNFIDELVKEEFFQQN